MFALSFIQSISLIVMFFKPSRYRLLNITFEANFVVLLIFCYILFCLNLKKCPFYLQRVEIKQPKILTQTPRKSSDTSTSDEVKIKEEPVDSVSGTAIHPEDRTASGSCELNDTPIISVSKEEDTPKDGSKAETEIYVSEELQSASRAAQDQTPAESDDKVLPGKTAENPTEKGNKIVKKETESSSGSITGAVSEVLNVTDLESEDADSVKTKDDMDAKPGK